jgi:PAS domain S-box-containing protein
MEKSKTLKVLMVEDSESDALFNIRALEKAGFEVSPEVVTTGPEMRAALSKQEWDLVLSDHNLPQFDSASALAIFKTARLEVPFIIVSGAIGEETAVNLMKNGAQDYVMKGNLARLAPVVERELQDAEIRRQRRKSEEKLLASEERFRQVAEVAGEMIWEVDARMKYLYVNPVAEEVTGYTPEELVGKMSLFDLFPPEVKQGYKASLEEYFEAKKPVKNFTSTRVRKDGRVVILETSATPILDGQNQLLGYRGTDNDITQRKQMEAEIGDLYQTELSQRKKLQEEAEVKNLFINVLAHELRNPLTAIVVSSDMLQETEDLKDEIKDRLATNINTSAKLLTRRLEELLDLARYSKGAIDLKKQNIDMSEYLKQVIGRFSPSLEKRGQSLEVEIPAELGTSLIDESRLEQVIINLLSNASKYSAEKSEIKLKAVRELEGLYIDVTDQGIGISPEDQGKLFQPYYRAVKNQGIAGIGLGLAISSKIVEAHGGQIRIISQLGEGSTFRVVLPK